MNKTAFCFDLDGTVTKQEILPLISKKIDLHEEINLLTDITLQGLIPFQTSFKLRVKLLSSVAISVVREVVNNVLLDEYICEFIKQNKEHCYIITGNLDVWVKTLIEEKIGCQSFSSIADSKNDKLLGIKTILDKGTAVTQLQKSYTNIVTIGDSMNDCPMFEKATTKIAYGGIHPPVDTLIKLSDYVIYSPKSLVSLLTNLNNEN